MNRLSYELSAVKLDVDRKKKPSRERIVRLLKRAGYLVLSLRMLQSRRGGWHVWIHVHPRPRTPFEVVALQAILGSDPRREVMNLARARKLWRTPGFAKSWWNVLYRRREFSQFPISHLNGDSTVNPHNLWNPRNPQGLG